MSSLKRARIAVTACFLTHGLVFSSWLPHIPLIKDDLGLSEGGLGLVLLAPPAGALTALSLTGAACARWGSAAVTRATLAAYCIVTVGIGLGVDSAWTLVAALALAGATVGSFDVSMNAQGAAVERAIGKPIMGSFHAAWALAAAAGAGLGGLAAQLGVALWLQLLVLSVAAYAATRKTTGDFVDDVSRRRSNGSGVDDASRRRSNELGVDDVSRRRSDGSGVADSPAAEGVPSRKWRLEPGLVLLAATAFAALLAEGAAADWSAVFLSQSLSATPLVAACGYGAFAFFMFVGRLAGDQLVGRFGRRRSVAAAASVGGAGMAAGLALAG
ncbi:MAG: MFS transporter, partial [Stackebrandtia sp.]